MPNKKPNNFVAPIVIAGITVGFLVSAYKYVFAKPKKSKKENLEQNLLEQKKASDLDDPTNS